MIGGFFVGFFVGKANAGAKGNLVTTQLTGINDFGTAGDIFKFGNAPFDK